jgi:3-deoxy-D-manno-octulosonate 8-phosphate phosphatase (KDO 8-P phosphatase)
MSKDLKKRIQKVKLLICDVDGVLTNGDIIVNHEGHETKTFDVQDGYGIVLLKKLGYHTAILSARFSHAVEFRGKDLKVDQICQNAYPKLPVYEQILKELNLKDDQVCFIADDLPDLGVFKRVGLAVAVNNAHAEIKKRAHYITKRTGGRGAVREAIELILKEKGEWNKFLKELQ